MGRYRFATLRLFLLFVKQRFCKNAAFDIMDKIKIESSMKKQ